MPHRGRYQLVEVPTYSAFSRPRREHPDGSYEIHLVKSDDPAYIPSDLETWPIFYKAIIECLVELPEAKAAVLKAIRDTRVKLTGLENRDAPPGSIPWETRTH